MSTEQHKFQDAGPEAYERKSVARVFGPLAIEFLKHFPVQEGERVLDVACGTGIVARNVAIQVGPKGHVKGIDLNPGMLKVAKSLEPSEGAKIEWHEGDATKLPFEEDEFDVVLCQQGLQFFSDKLSAIGEMFRVLAEGGRVGICIGRSIEHAPYNLAKAEALGRHVGPEAEEKERNRTPFSLGRSEALFELILGAGFKDVQIQQLEFTSNMGLLDETVNEASFPDLDSEIAAKVVSDVHETLQPYVSNGYLYAPVKFNLGVGYKK